MTDQGTILVVDDTSANLKLLVDTLTAEGYQVRPADSGELALAAVAARPPELIRLDIRMPGVDGFEVFRRLQARPESRDIPVVFISAFGESAERVEGFKLGAVDFITKPFQRKELLARVQTHLELGRLRVRLEQQAADLRRANEQLQTELAERQRSEAVALTLNQEMQASRSAALNLMDDAVEARNRLETANQELWSEMAEREQAEQSLEDSLSLLQATLESTADGLLVVNQTGQVVQFNQKFAELWRIPANILASHDDSRAIAFVLEQLKDPGSFVAQVKELYAQPEAVSFDILEFKDGRTFERYSQPQKVGGKGVGRVWSFRDITERKRAEAKIAEQLDELRRWHDALLGREGRVLEVKKEANELLARLGEPPRYPSALEGSEQ